MKVIYMAELFDKLIQDGRVSFVPRSQKTRKFWAKHNSRVAGSQNAAKETVTIFPASDDEVKEWMGEPTVTVKTPTVPVPVIDNTIISELQRQMQAQQEQIQQQQEMIQQLLERGKPGPKPKNNTDGENKETVNA